MMDSTLTLYPDWSGPSVDLPGWVVRYGLKRYRPVLQRVYASAPHWQQAERDGLKNIAPIIVLFNAAPTDIRSRIGKGAWKQVHHAKLTANVDRLVLCMLGGWSFVEALLYPADEKRRAKTRLVFGREVLLLACRLAARGGSLTEWVVMARDVQRMGGQLDQTWGRKRLRREHDARVMKQTLGRTDPTPWADPWFFDVGPYTFTLLKSEAELALEGALQRHCVRSYARACRDGHEVVLRIEGAERATCSWNCGQLEIQVQGFANSSVSPECRAAAAKAQEAYLEMAKAKKGAAS